MATPVATPFRKSRLNRTPVVRTTKSLLSLYKGAATPTATTNTPFGRSKDLQRTPPNASAFQQQQKQPAMLLPQSHTPAAQNRAECKLPKTPVAQDSPVAVKAMRTPHLNNLQQQHKHKQNGEQISTLDPFAKAPVRAERRLVALSAEERARHLEAMITADTSAQARVEQSAEFLARQAENRKKVRALKRQRAAKKASEQKAARVEKRKESRRAKSAAAAAAAAAAVAAKYTTAMPTVQPAASSRRRSISRTSKKIKATATPALPDPVEEPVEADSTAAAAAATAPAESESSITNPAEANTSAQQLTPDGFVSRIPAAPVPASLRKKNTVAAVVAEMIPAQAHAATAGKTEEEAVKISDEGETGDNTSGSDESESEAEVENDIWRLAQADSSGTTETSVETTASGHQPESIVAAAATTTAAPMTTTATSLVPTPPTASTRPLRSSARLHSRRVTRTKGVLVQHPVTAVVAADATQAAELTLDSHCVFSDEDLNEIVAEKTSRRRRKTSRSSAASVRRSARVAADKNSKHHSADSPQVKGDFRAPSESPWIAKSNVVTATETTKAAVSTTRMSLGTALQQSKALLKRHGLPAPAVPDAALRYAAVGLSDEELSDLDDSVLFPDNEVAANDSDNNNTNNFDDDAVEENTAEAFDFDDDFSVGVQEDLLPLVSSERVAPSSSLGSVGQRSSSKTNKRKVVAAVAISSLGSIAQKTSACEDLCSEPLPLKRTAAPKMTPVPRSSLSSFGSTRLSQPARRRITSGTGSSDGDVGMSVLGSLQARRVAKKTVPAAVSEEKKKKQSQKKKKTGKEKKPSGRSRAKRVTSKKNKTKKTNKTHVAQPDDESDADAILAEMMEAKNKRAGASASLSSLAATVTEDVEVKSEKKAPVRRNKALQALSPHCNVPARSSSLGGLAFSSAKMSKRVGGAAAVTNTLSPLLASPRTKKLQQRASSRRTRIPEDLHSLSRQDLQALAKAHGIKANAKTTVIVSSLRNLPR